MTPKRRRRLLPGRCGSGVSEASRSTLSPRAPRRRWRPWQALLTSGGILLRPGQGDSRCSTCSCRCSLPRMCAAGFGNWGDDLERTPRSPATGDAERMQWLLDGWPTTGMTGMIRRHRTHGPTLFLGSKPLEKQTLRQCSQICSRGPCAKGPCPLLAMASGPRLGW